MPPAEHTVDLTGRAREQLRSITRRAGYAGRARTVLDAVKRIVARLRLQPRDCGDPLYRLRKMRMQLFHTVDRPLYVEYGVHESQPLVVIRSFVLITDQPD